MMVITGWRGGFINNMNYQIYEVSGRSLEGDGIYDEDLAVVDTSKKIKNDDIVVLNVNKGHLIKHFYKKNGHLMFYPFNRESPSKKTASAILDKAKIIGKVVAIIRKKNK